MERLLLITMAWTFIVGGAIYLAVLLEHLLHHRKMARIEDNYRRMKLHAPTAGWGGDGERGASTA